MHRFVLYLRQAFFGETKFEIVIGYPFNEVKVHSNG